MIFCVLLLFLRNLAIKFIFLAMTENSKSVHIICTCM